MDLIQSGIFFVDADRSDEIFPGKKILPKPYSPGEQLALRFEMDDIMIQSGKVMPHEPIKRIRPIPWMRETDQDHINQADEKPTPKDLDLAEGWIDQEYTEEIQIKNQIKKYAVQITGV